jgi:hypothetical protein
LTDQSDKLDHLVLEILLSGISTDFSLLHILVIETECVGPDADNNEIN